VLFRICIKIEVIQIYTHSLTLTNVVFNTIFWLLSNGQRLYAELVIMNVTMYICVILHSSPRDA